MSTGRQRRLRMRRGRLFRLVLAGRLRGSFRSGVDSSSGSWKVAASAAAALLALVELTDRLDAGRLPAHAEGSCFGRRPASPASVRGRRVGRGSVRLRDVAVVARAQDPNRRVAVAEAACLSQHARLLVASWTVQRERLRAPGRSWRAGRWPGSPSRSSHGRLGCPSSASGHPALVGVLLRQLTFTAAAFEDAMFACVTEPPSPLLSTRTGAFSFDAPSWNVSPRANASCSFFADWPIDLESRPAVLPWSAVLLRHVQVPGERRSTSPRSSARRRRRHPC